MKRREAADSEVMDQTDTLKAFSVAHSVQFNGGAVEVRDYTWRKSTANIWSRRAYFFDLAVTPRPDPAWGAYLDGARAHGQIGRIMFVPAGRTVRIGASAGKHRSMHCSLAAEMVEGILPHDPVWDDASLAEGLHLRGPEVEWVLLKIYGELKQPGFATALTIESLATVLAVALIRRFQLEDRKGFPTRPGGLASSHMNKLRDRIHAEAPAPTLSEMAQLCGMSVRHLSRTFKAETGQTVADYVQRATIARAHRLLTESDAPVSDIARALGFSGSTSFAVAFRRATGLRPTQLKGRHRRESMEASPLS